MKNIPSRTTGDLTELKSADAYCRHLTRRHYENFSVISVLLSPEIRTHLSRIYAFCRTTDDFGDESGSQGIARLAQWRDEVDACFQSDPPPIHPVLIALKVTIQALGFSPAPFLDLIAANVQDQSVTSYETWDDLRRYCMLSAAPVGRMVLRVFDVDDDAAETLADDVCIGLQLANHAQDVQRDADRGRSYLIQDIVRRKGVQCGIQDLVDRADQLLASGERLEPMVPRRLRAQLAIYRLGGMEVVRAVRRLDHRTDLVRPTISRTQKLTLLGRALRQSMS